MISRNIAVLVGLVLPMLTSCKHDDSTSGIASADGVTEYDSDDATSSTDTSTSTSTNGSPTKSGDPLADGLALIQKDAMIKELTHITKDEFQGRLSATPENEKVADWLIEQLKSLNIAPGIEGYRQRFTMPNGPTSGQKAANIIGKIEGTDPTLKNEYIVIGAHMDHTGTLERGYTCAQGAVGDSICNGADDNGSGTIALLSVAKAMAAAQGSLKRSVLLIWFAGEEEGLHGSKHYVNQPVVPLKNTIYMVNMDMVGYAQQNSNRIEALGANSSDTAFGILKETVKKYKDKYTFPIGEPGGYSDHASFLVKGIPCVMFHTGLSSNPNYHRTTDHADLIDYDGLAVVAKITFEAVLKYANSTEGASLTERQARRPIISEEEAAKGCHDLIDAKKVFIGNM